MGLVGPIFQLALIFRVKGKVKSISPIESLMLWNNCVISITIQVIDGPRILLLLL